MEYAGLRSDTDRWLGSYEDATTLANDALGSIQVHPPFNLQAPLWLLLLHRHLTVVAIGAEPQVCKWWP